MPSTWPKSPDLMRNIFDMTRMNMPTSIDVVRDAFYIADISNERMTCVDRSNVVMHSTCPTPIDLMGHVFYIADDSKEASIDLMCECVLRAASDPLAM